MRTPTLDDLAHALNQIEGVTARVYARHFQPDSGTLVIDHLDRRLEVEHHECCPGEFVAVLWDEDRVIDDEVTFESWRYGSIAAFSTHVFSVLTRPTLEVIKRAIERKNNPWNAS